MCNHPECDKRVVHLFVLWRRKREYVGWICPTQHSKYIDHETVRMLPRSKPWLYRRCTQPDKEAGLGYKCAALSWPVYVRTRGSWSKAGFVCAKLEVTITEPDVLKNRPRLGRPALLTYN